MLAAAFAPVVPRLPPLPMQEPSLQGWQFDDGWRLVGDFEPIDGLVEVIHRVLSAQPDSIVPVERFIIDRDSPLYRAIAGGEDDPRV
jgi:hypothetical protein